MSPETEGLWREIKALQHAMQSGVAERLHFDPSDTTPKHLRVGINAAMVEHGALAKLLIDKGVIGEREYLGAVRDMMKLEVERYQAELSHRFGVTIKLG